MSTQNTQSLQAAMASFNDWKETEGTSGGGQSPYFPDAGTSEVDLIGYSVKDVDFNYSAEDGSRMSIPGVPRLAFEYEVSLAENHPSFVEGGDNVKSFFGDPIDIVSNDLAAGLPDKQQTRCRIGKERLKGMLTGILDGESSGSAEDDLGQVLSMIDEGTSIPVMINVKLQKEYQGERRKTEYIKGRA